MSASQNVLNELSRSARVPAPSVKANKRLDVWLVLGLVVAAGAALAAAASTGVGLQYFLQPRGAAIVLGGTLGVIFVTTPGRALGHSARRVLGLFSVPAMEREALVEQIIAFSRASRFKGIATLEETARSVGNDFLREAMLLATEVESRTELQSVLETRLRVRERQSEADAKTLEVAGGFAPTLGILGTVVGLIEVLRQFSNLESVSFGIGMAFVSTIYGLGLANLVLLPAAHRIRARGAEAFEFHELIVEGVLCLFDQVHPALVRQRLGAYLRETHARPGATRGRSYEA